MPLAGLEPALLAEPDFESGVSTNSTIEAQTARLPVGGKYIGALPLVNQEITIYFRRLLRGALPPVADTALCS